MTDQIQAKFGPMIAQINDCLMIHDTSCEVFFAQALLAPTAEAPSSSGGNYGSKRTECNLAAPY